MANLIKVLSSNTVEGIESMIQSALDSRFSPIGTISVNTYFVEGDSNVKTLFVQSMIGTDEAPPASESEGES